MASLILNSHSPLDNSSNILINHYITLQFATNVSGTPDASGSILVTAGTNSKEYSTKEGTSDITINGSNVTINTGDLDYSSNYIIDISKNAFVDSNSGDIMENDINFSFVTERDIIDMTDDLAAENVAKKTGISNQYLLDIEDGFKDICNNKFDSDGTIDNSKKTKIINYTKNIFSKIKDGNKIKKDTSDSRINKKDKRKMSLKVMQDVMRKIIYNSTKSVVKQKNKKIKLDVSETKEIFELMKEPVADSDSVSDICKNEIKVDRYKKVKKKLRRKPMFLVPGVKATDPKDVSAVEINMKKNTLYTPFSKDEICNIYDVSKSRYYSMTLKNNKYSLKYGNSLTNLSDVDLSGNDKAGDIFVDKDLSLNIIWGSALITETDESVETIDVYAYGGKFYLNGIQAPEYTFEIGKTYIFDQSDSRNANPPHPLRFSTISDGRNGYVQQEYTTNVTYGVEPIGSDGAYIQIVITQDTPSPLYYYCQAHTNMGNSIVVTSNNSVSTSPLTLISRSPLNNSSNISIDTNITLQFATDVSGTSDDSDGIFIKKDGTDETRQISSIVIDGSKVTVDISGNLDYSSNYIVEISKNAFVDANTGASMENDINFNFVTKSDTATVKIKSSGKISIDKTNGDIILVDTMPDDTNMVMKIDNNNVVINNNL